MRTGASTDALQARAHAEDRWGVRPFRGWLAWSYVGANEPVLGAGGPASVASGAGARLRYPAMDEGTRALIDAAWEKLQADWPSDEAHRRFIALCALHNALGEAGSRYRSAQAASTHAQADLERHLNAVMAAALEQLARSRTPRRERGKRAMWLMVGACGFMVVYAILTLLRVRSQ